MTLLDDLRVGDRAGELARVGAAEGELAVGHGLLGGRLEGHGDDLGGDRALVEEVVGHGGDAAAAAHGALGEVGRADAEDTVNALEALGLRGDADRLILNDQRLAEGDGVGVYGCMLVTGRRMIRESYSHSVPEKEPEP